MEEIVPQTDATEASPAWAADPSWYQDPSWGSIHLMSDFAIWAACLAIPVVLLIFVRRRRDFPFLWVLYLFAGFVLAFGLTHLLEATQYYWPASRWLAMFKLATAIFAWATVAALFPVLPRVLRFRSPEESAQEVAQRTAELSQMAKRLTEEIDAREAMNRELRESREMLQLALTASDTGSFDWDLQSDEVVFDATQIRLTGFGGAGGRLKAQEFFDRIAEGHRDEVVEAVQRSIAENHRYEARFPFVKPDGSQVWLAAHGCVIRDVDGEPVRLIGLNRDVTETVEREAELDETAKTAVSASRHKSRFIAQVSHEIRTPLTAMLGCIDALMPEMPEGDVRQTLRTVRSQGEMLRILLNDVLDLSKIEAGKLTIHNEPVSVPSVLASVCSLMEPLAREKGLELHRRADSLLPNRFDADPYRLRQVLLNLVGNAIKFTSSGEVTLVSRVESDGDGGTGRLVVEVRDTGIGIDPDSLARIFREFEQAGEQETGSGLGLAICHRLTSMMGGNIEACSELGGGSVFIVRLPIDDLERCELSDADGIVAESGADKIEAAQQRTYPLRLLVAEDTPAIQFVIRRIVGVVVEELVIVDNGRDAIDAVLSAEMSGEPFDLVVMDIQMPQVNGIEATRQLRRDGFDRPIVALTAGTMDEEKQECMAAGCSHFLSKPIDVESLHQLLATLARERTVARRESSTPSHPLGNHPPSNAVR